LDTHHTYDVLSEIMEICSDLDLDLDLDSDSALAFTHIPFHFFPTDNFPQINIGIIIMLIKIIPIIGLMSLIETMSQSAVKYAYLYPSVKYIGLLGPIGYTIICYLLYYMYSYESMALINTWGNIVTTTTITIAGVVFFGESLKGYDLIGIASVIMGAIFLSINKLK
jgi:drug/metabolite transporter (DMT)-like permease